MPDSRIGNIVASPTQLWLNPSKWPISCVATLWMSNAPAPGTEGVRKLLLGLKSTSLSTICPDSTMRS